MTIEHAEELKKLEEHIRNVLDLFPWPEDSLHGEGGFQKAFAGSMLRTPQQVDAENRLRDLRVGLGGALGAISNHLVRG